MKARTASASERRQWAIRAAIDAGLTAVVFVEDRRTADDLVRQADVIERYVRNGQLPK